LYDPYIHFSRGDHSFCERYPIRKLALFGSVLRDDFNPDSDVDVLVEFVPDSGITYLSRNAL
jgi:predicted nucleotidyltransferase